MPGYRKCIYSARREKWGCVTLSVKWSFITLYLWSGIKLHHCVGDAASVRVLREAELHRTAFMKWIEAESHWSEVKRNEAASHRVSELRRSEAASLFLNRNEAGRVADTKSRLRISGKVECALSPRMNVCLCPECFPIGYFAIRRVFGHLQITFCIVYSAPLPHAFSHMKRVDFPPNSVLGQVLPRVLPSFWITLRHTPAHSNSAEKKFQQIKEVLVYSIVIFLLSEESLVIFLTVCTSEFCRIFQFWNMGDNVRGIKICRKCFRIFHHVQYGIYSFS